jgi:serine/threonine protein kinase
MGDSGYCHSMKVVHRDIKAENVMINKHDCVKLIDFGFSRIWSKADMMSTSCGSPHYAAPEIVNDQSYNGPEVDIWSMGVLLYVMLCGKHPFNSPSIRGLFQKITEGDVDIPKGMDLGA